MDSRWTYTLGLLLASSMAWAADTPSEKSAEKSTEKGGVETTLANEFKVNEWFALGSGCRAKHDQPGTVTMDYLGSDPKDPMTHLVRFTLGSYELDGDKPVRTNPTFARECAMRMSVTLPTNTQVKAVAAEAGAQIRVKSKPVKLQVASQFHLGASIVASKIDVHEVGKDLKNYEHRLDLKAVKGVDKDFPDQVCGSPKVVGLDLSLQNWRDKKEDTVYVNMAGDKTVLVKVTLEACVPKKEDKK